MPRPKAAEWQQLLVEAEDLPVNLSTVRHDIAHALQQQQEVEGQLAAALASPETAASLSQLWDLQQQASSCSVFIGCLEETEQRLLQLQQLEEAAAAHLNGEETARSQLQQFVQQQEQLLQLPVHTPDLPCFSRLKDACNAVAAWTEETAQLHLTGGSLRQWQQHLQRGVSLRIKPEGLEQLQQQLHESEKWCAVYQHLLELRVAVRCQNASAAAAVVAEMLRDSSGPPTILPPAAAAAAAAQQQQQEEQGTGLRAYVSLLDAERLTRRPFGLGPSLLPFAELQQHIRHAQQLRRRCCRVLQQSYRERAACLFGIAAGADPQPEFAAAISEAHVHFLCQQQQQQQLSAAAAAEADGDTTAAATAAAAGGDEQQQRQQEEERQKRLHALQEEEQQRIRALQLLSPDEANALLWRTTRRLRQLAAACAAGKVHVKERRLLKVEVRPIVPKP